MTFDDYLRYVRQQTTPAQARAVRAWLADPANAQQAQAWMQQYAALQEQEADATGAMPDFEAMQAELLLQLGLTPAKLPTHRLRSRPYWAAAAVLLGGLLAGGAWLWRAAPTAPALATAATAYGELRTVRLPDGSTVQLNGHSTLRYAANLGQAAVREVWLDGEAFFAVRHLPTHRRFVVHTTAGLNVEVLGTRFTVYRRHAQARVVLLSGKVRVSLGGQGLRKEVVLRPGELLETHDAQPTYVAHKAVNTAPYAAWKDHKLVFDETSLADVATQLSDTYGVAVSLETPALAAYRFTGTYPVGEVETVLQVLEKSFPVKVRRRPGHYVISNLPPSLAP